MHSFFVLSGLKISGNILHFLLNSFWAMPAFLLKKMIMNNFTAQEVDEDIADSIDFMVERVS